MCIRDRLRMGRVGEVVDRKDFVALERREAVAGGGEHEPRPGIRLKIRLDRHGLARIERRDSKGPDLLPFKESLVLLEPCGVRAVRGERDLPGPVELYVLPGRRVVEK